MPKNASQSADARTAPNFADIRSHVSLTSAYGLFYIVAAIYLAFSGFMSLFTGQPLHVGRPHNGTPTPTEISIVVFQAWFFALTGIMILRAKMIAVPLVWTTVGLSGVGVLFRGLTPLDLILWLAWAGLAAWYTKKKSQLAAWDSRKDRKILIIGASSLAALAALLSLALIQFGPGHARTKLAELGIRYASESFVQAAHDDDTSVVKLFLDSGMDPSVMATFNGHKNPITASQAAAMAGNTEVVRLLLDKGVDPNELLTYAVSHANVTRLLLQRGADPNKKNGQGVWEGTPLMNAAMHGDPQTVAVLLDYGANVNDGTDAVGASCDTPLMVASLRGHTDVMNILIARGANVRATKNDDTAFSCAEINDNDELLRVLLNNGAIPDGSDVSLAMARGKTYLAVLLQQAMAKK